MIRYIALVTATLLLIVSCSGGSDTNTTQVPKSTPVATIAQLAPIPTEQPPTPTAMLAPAPEPLTLEWALKIS